MFYSRAAFYGLKTSVSGLLLLLALFCSTARAANWTIETTPNGTLAEHSSLFDISCEPESTNTCTAVGSQTISGTSSPYAQYWNGKSWANQSAETPVGATAGELQSDHCLSKTSCVAAGSYTTASGTFSLIESWSGSSWTIQSSPNPAGATETKLRGVSCNVITACIAVGYSNSGGKWATAIRGNSGTWSLQTIPKPAESTSSELLGVECTSATSCMAVGAYNTSASTYWAMAAYWNGTEWSLKTVPKPAESKRSILLDVSCSDASNCTAVGAYTNASSVQVTFVERWNGTSWSLQTSPNPSGSSNSVLQNISCEDRNICVAVGDWLNAGTWQPMAQRWNGASWTLDSAANPSGSTFGLLEGVSCRVNCLAVGWYTNAEGKNRTLGETRETPGWTQRTIGTPSGSSLSGISCYGSNSCLAVGLGGSFASAYFGGVTWTELTPPKPSEITFSQLRDSNCLVEGGTCTAVGTYTKGGVEKPYATRWVESGAWTLYDPLPLPTGSTSGVLNDVSCTGPGACTAVGDFKESGSPRTYVIRWNGTSWAVQSSPNVVGASEDVLKSVSCASSTACTAVGYASSETGEQPLIESWNGTTWSIQSTSLPSGGERGQLFGVSCPSTTVCLAAGRYWDSSAGEALVTKWNGTSWTAQAAPRPVFAEGSHLEDISCASSTACVAVGAYFKLGAPTRALAASWDGSGWTLQNAVSPGTTENFLFAVSCLSATSCRGSGYSNSGSGSINLAETYP